MIIYKNKYSLFDIVGIREKSVTLHYRLQTKFIAEDKAMTGNVDLSVQRDALISQLYQVDDVDVIQKVQRSLNRALATVKKVTAKKDEEEEEYITKEELMNDLRNSFIEYYTAQKEGRKLRSLRELINEL